MSAKLQAVFEGDSTPFETAYNRVVGLTAALPAVFQRMTAPIATATQAATDTMNRLGAATQAMGAQVSSVFGQVQSGAAQMQSAIANTATVVTTGLQRQGAAVADFEKRFTGAMDRAMGAAKSLGTQLLTLASGGGFGSMVSRSIETETSVARLATQMGKTVPEVQALKDAFEEMSKAPGGRSVAELADAYTDGLKKQIPIILDNATALHALDVAQKLATATSGDTSEALRTVGAAQRVFGGSVDEVADKLLRTYQLAGSKASWSQLEQSFGKSAEAARELGLGLDQYLGAVATLAETSGSATRAGQELLAVFRGLLKPSKAAADFAREHGIEITRERIANEGLAAVLADITEKLHGNTAAYAQLFPQQRAHLAFMHLMAPEAGQAFGAVTAKIKDSTGAVTKASETMAQTVANQLKTLQNNFQSVGNAIFEALGPKIKAAIQALIEWLQKLDVHAIASQLESFGETVVKVGEFLSNFAGTAERLIKAIVVGKLFGFMADGIKTAAGAAETLSVAFRSVGTAASVGLLGPIGALAKIISLLYTAVSLAMDLGNALGEAIAKRSDIANVTGADANLATAKKVIEDRARTQRELIAELRKKVDAGETINVTGYQAQFRKQAEEAKKQAEDIRKGIEDLKAAKAAGGTHAGELSDQIFVQQKRERIALGQAATFGELAENFTGFSSRAFRESAEARQRQRKGAGLDVPTAGKEQTDTLYDRQARLLDSLTQKRIKAEETAAAQELKIREDTISKSEHLEIDAFDQAKTLIQNRAALETRGALERAETQRRQNEAMRDEDPNDPKVARAFKETRAAIERDLAAELIRVEAERAEKIQGLQDKIDAKVKHSAEAERAMREKIAAEANAEAEKRLKIPDAFVQGGIGGAISEAFKVLDSSLRDVGKEFASIGDTVSVFWNSIERRAIQVGKSIMDGFFHLIGSGIDWLAGKFSEFIAVAGSASKMLTIEEQRHLEDLQTGYAAMILSQKRGIEDLQTSIEQSRRDLAYMGTRTLSGGGTGLSFSTPEEAARARFELQRQYDNTQFERAQAERELKRKEDDLRIQQEKNRVEAERAAADLADAQAKAADPLRYAITNARGTGVADQASKYLDTLAANAGPLMDLIVQTIQKLVPKLQVIIGPVIQAIVRGLDPIFRALEAAIGPLVQAFIDELPELIKGLLASLNGMIETLIEVIIGKTPKLAVALVDGIVRYFWSSSFWIDLPKAIGEGVYNAIKDLLPGGDTIGKLTFSGKGDASQKAGDFATSAAVVGGLAALTTIGYGLIFGGGGSGPGGFTSGPIRPGDTSNPNGPNGATPPGFGSGTGGFDNPPDSPDPGRNLPGGITIGRRHIRPADLRSALGLDDFTATVAAVTSYLGGAQQRRLDPLQQMVAQFARGLPQLLPAAAGSASGVAAGFANASPQGGSGQHPIVNITITGGTAVDALMRKYIESSVVTGARKQGSNARSLREIASAEPPGLTYASEIINRNQNA